MVDEWASYEEALDGEPVFATAFNVQYERWDILAGRVASKDVQKTVVKGMDYHWDRNTRSSSAGLLWRTSCSAQERCSYWFDDRDFIPCPTA